MKFRFRAYAGIMAWLALAAAVQPLPQAACTIAPVAPGDLVIQFGHSTYWTATAFNDPNHAFYGNPQSKRAQISTKVVYEGSTPPSGYGGNTEYIGIRTKDNDEFIGQPQGRNEVGGNAATVAGGLDGKIRISMQVHNDGGPGHAEWGPDYLLTYSPTATGSPTTVSPTSVMAGTATNLEFDVWILGSKGCQDRTDVGLSLNIHVREGIDAAGGILPSHELVDIEITAAEYHDPSGNITPCKVGWNRWARWLIEESGR